MKTIELTQKWDKIFPLSDQVEHSKVTFPNRFGITLAADVYKPKNASGKLAAIAVSGPILTTLNLFGVEEERMAAMQQKIRSEPILSSMTAPMQKESG